MALRGKKPEDRLQRLKLLMSGPAGVGKTTASIQMPKPYIIDTERGSTHYGDTIEKVGGVVYESSSVDDVIKEVRSLMTEKHDYLTLVIDPITTLFNNAVDDAEKKVGSDFGRHYGEANKAFKRLCSLLTAIDMNVVITAHEKNEMGDGMKVIGKTFDGYKKLDYIFDLWLQLEKDRSGGKRFATVAKTRLEEFPDMARFEWCYAELVKRYGKDRLEKGVETVVLATPDQIERFKFLMSSLTEAEVKALKIDKALDGVEDLSDLPAERIAKGITIIEQYKSKQAAA